MTSVFGGLLNDKVNPTSHTKEGGRPKNSERDERPVALDDNDTPRNPSKRGQLQIS